MAHPLIFKIAEELRNSMTKAEEILWNYLETNSWGLKFRRQHPVSIYVADFYCHKLKLIIEIDGGIHEKEDVKRNDIVRENHLRQLGLNIIRFKNEEVIQRPELVLKKIEEYIRLPLGLEHHPNSPLGVEGKQLLLIRHAKSSWDNPSQKDFDRPLNERGHRDAAIMAKRLFEKNVLIDAFISSTAKRALTTAVYFAQAYKQDAFEIIQHKELYLANTEIFDEVVFDIDNALNTVALFSHNDGITQYANSLTTTQIDNMPTCSIFAVKANAKSWKDFDLVKKEFWFFDYPKLG